MEGLKIVLDCANGAAYKVAPAIFEELGAEVIVIGNQPNGFNINENCGALFPENLKKEVLKYKADVGVGLDGDGDRLIMVDEKGGLLDGDHLLVICALHKFQNQTLSQNSIVTTHISSMAVENSLNPYGIKVFRAPVGDKYVVQEMKKRRLILGGEPSGHIVHLEHSTTGDACVAALNILSVMKKDNKKLSQLRSLMTEIPRISLNTKVKKKQALETLPGYKKLMKDCENQWKGEGRVLVRYSGTEPVVRVFVEGKDPIRVSHMGKEIRSFLEKELS